MNQGVPFNDLKRIHEPLRDEIDAAIAAVLDSQRFILGPNVSAFEEALTQSYGVEAAVGVSSGTDALLAALMALEIGPGDEVITTPYTFFATAGAIARLGATPVFVDIESDTFNICPEAVEKRIGAKTRAIVPVHLFGQCADMVALTKLAKDAELPVIEDAAQSINAQDSLGRAAGSIGEMCCFSFFPAKNLGAFGDGGAITTQDEKMATKLRALRAHGSPQKYMHDAVGGNFRLDAIQAAILLVKLPHLAAWTTARQTLANRYRSLFQACGLDEVLGLPAAREGTHVYNQFVIRAPQRDALRTHLSERNIASAVYYPLALHQQPCFQYLQMEEGSLPEAERATAETLALPIFPGMRDQEQEQVVDAISGFYR